MSSIDSFGFQGQRGTRPRATVPSEHVRDIIFSVVQQWQSRERCISMQALQAAMDRQQAALHRHQFVENPHAHLALQNEADHLPGPALEEDEDEE